MLLSLQECSYFNLLPCIFCCFSCFIPSQLLHAAQNKKLAMTYVSACVQLSTTEGNSYYVGTKMDAFVFDTLNTWYQEDMGVNSVRASFSHSPAGINRWTSSVS